MATTSDHNFLVRVISEDGDLIIDDTDFAADARFDWFEEALRQSDEGDVVRLIDTSDDRVILEKVRDLSSELQAVVHPSCNIEGCTTLVIIYDYSSEMPCQEPSRV